MIDARMKPGFPAELFADPDTAAPVTRRWSEYFPGRRVAGWATPRRPTSTAPDPRSGRRGHLAEKGLETGMTA